MDRSNRRSNDHRPMPLVELKVSGAPQDARSLERLAGAVKGQFLDHGTAMLRGMGVNACRTAIVAIATARSWLGDGHPCLVVPEMTDADIDGTDKTVLVLKVEPCSSEDALSRLSFEVSILGQNLAPATICDMLRTAMRTNPACDALKVTTATDKELDTAVKAVVQLRSELVCHDLQVRFYPTIGFFQGERKYTWLFVKGTRPLAI